MKLLIQSILVGLLVAGTASAKTLQIQFDGLDLVYDGQFITDAGSFDGGIYDPSEADVLASVDFFVDGVLVGTLSDDIFADIGLDVGAIPTDGTFVTSSTLGIFDILTKPAAPAFGLGLDTASVSVAIINGGLALFGAGTVDTVDQQDLPFGLAISEVDKITFSFSSNLLNGLTSSQGFYTGFSSQGTGEVSGQIPEPATVLLMGLGALGAARARTKLA